MSVTKRTNKITGRQTFIVVIWSTDSNSNLWKMVNSSSLSKFQRLASLTSLFRKTAQTLTTDQHYCSSQAVTQDLPNLTTLSANYANNLL